MKTKKKISTRILVAILPVVLIGLVVLTGISIKSSNEVLTAMVESLMTEELSGQDQVIEMELTAVEGMAKQIAIMVGASYQNTDLSSYETMLGDIIYTNDMVMGSGIWFEPYAYDKGEKYVGPYVYKEGETPVTTYDYSNADYDYFSYEFYTNVSGGTKDAVMTDPYYDETSGAVMSSYSAPIYDSKGKFIGAVTVDINLESIQEIVNSIQVGSTGKAILLNSETQYLATPDTSKILNEKLTESSDANLAEVGKQILSMKEGNITYKDNGETMNAYFSSVGNMGWTLIITTSESEKLATVSSLAEELIITAIVVLIAVILVILWQVSKISKEIKRVQSFATKLSEGDLTVDSLESKKKDELGAMANALDEMYESNKDMIGKISDYAHTLESESANLGKAAKEFADQFGNIEHLLRNVNDDMASTGAATEEVNASVEEVNSTIMILAEETEKSTTLANEIKERASEIEKNSQKSFEQTKLLSREHEEKLNESIGHADVVKSIGEMAEVITGIAGQINMLSLNASIEAARAGEMGRGFAVVAEEIGKLAGETSLAANEIKGTITQVQETFDGLVKNSGAMLSFVKDNITPDYDTFVSVAKQYEQDAVEIETFSREIGKMTEGIERIISEVANAIQSIAESSQNTVENGNNIINSIELASDLIGQVDEMATENGEISKELTKVVRGFKIKK